MVQWLRLPAPSAGGKGSTPGQGTQILYAAWCSQKQKKPTTLFGTSLAVQWLRRCASTVGGVGSIPAQGTKIPHAKQCGQKIEKKKRKHRMGFSGAEWGLDVPLHPPVAWNGVTCSGVLSVGPALLYLHPHAAAMRRKKVMRGGASWHLPLSSSFSGDKGTQWGADFTPPVGGK